MNKRVFRVEKTFSTLVYAADSESAKELSRDEPHYDWNEDDFEAYEIGKYEEAAESYVILDDEDADAGLPTTVGELCTL